MGGSNSVPGEGRSLSSACVIPLAGGKGRNLFSKGFPDFPFSFTEQRERAVRPQGRTAPKGTLAFFSLLKRFQNFPYLSCCFSPGGVGAVPCTRGGGSLRASYTSLRPPNSEVVSGLSWRRKGTNPTSTSTTKQTSDGVWLSRRNYAPPTSAAAQ